MDFCIEAPQGKSDIKGLFLEFYLNLFRKSTSKYLQDLSNERRASGDRSTDRSRKDYKQLGVFSELDL